MTIPVKHFEVKSIYDVIGSLYINLYNGLGGYANCNETIEADIQESHNQGVTFTKYHPFPVKLNCPTYSGGNNQTVLGHLWTSDLFYPAMSPKPRINTFTLVFNISFPAMPDASCQAILVGKCYDAQPHLTLNYTYICNGPSTLHPVNFQKGNTLCLGAN